MWAILCQRLGRRLNASGPGESWLSTGVVLTPLLIVYWKVKASLCHQSLLPCYSALVWRPSIHRLSPLKRNKMSSSFSCFCQVFRLWEGLSWEGDPVLNSLQQCFVIEGISHLIIQIGILGRSNINELCPSGFLHHFTPGSQEADLSFFLQTWQRLRWDKYKLFIFIFH